MNDDETDLTDELESADCLEDQLDILYAFVESVDRITNDDGDCDNCLGQGYDKYGHLCTQCGIPS